LETIYNLLHQASCELTTWEIYVAEVDSGYLQWGAIHTDKFFKENARKMEDKDFGIVRALVRLAGGEDEEIAAIACYDIGEFVQYYPNGRVIAKKLGARDIVMNLIRKDDNPELYRHALQCVSKMLVQNWQVSSL
jgi:V-type H+-transporting ATPase subunit H